MNLSQSKLTKSQQKSMTKIIGSEKLIVKIRHDDSCGNGHNTFSITATLYEKTRGAWKDVADGCMHDEVKRFFPELEPYIKWHLCSTDGPMHYIANSLYHAGDRDHWGLRKGERRQIKNGRTGLPCWKLEIIPLTGDGTAKPKEYIDSEEQPDCPFIVSYVPLERVGEGKDPVLAAARECAIWPEAELEDFTEEKLLARLPDLMREFKAAVESLGLEY